MTKIKVWLKRVVWKMLRFLSKLKFCTVKKNGKLIYRFLFISSRNRFFKIRSPITTMTTMGAPQKSSSQKFHNNQRKSLTLESLGNKVAGWNLKAWTCNLIKNRLLHRHFATYIVKSQEYLSWRTSSNDCLW